MTPRKANVLEIGLRLLLPLYSFALEEESVTDLTLRSSNKHQQHVCLFIVDPWGEISIFIRSQLGLAASRLNCLTLQCCK